MTALSYWKSRQGDSEPAAPPLPHPSSPVRCFIKTPLGKHQAPQTSFQNECICKQPAPALEPLGWKKKKLRTKINWSVNCVRQGNQSEQVRLCSASCCAEQVDVDAGGASERQSETWSSVLCCRTFALKDSGLNLSAASEFTAEENSIKCARLRYSPSSQPSEKVCKK